MQKNDTIALQRRMRMLAFAVHSQLLESEPLSKAEAARLERMVRDGLAPDEGIAVLKKLWALPMHRYAAAPDPYILPGSAVLKNIPGLDEAEQLAAFERNAVAWRSLSIPTGHYDVAHLKAIHKHLSKTFMAGPGNSEPSPWQRAQAALRNRSISNRKPGKFWGGSR